MAINYKAIKQAAGAVLIGATLAGGLAACASGSIYSINPDEARAYSERSINFSLYYKGPKDNPDEVVMDPAGGLEMTVNGWAK